MSQQDKKLTGVFGHPVSDRENSMTAGPRGPLLMQDIYFLEQMSQFDRSNTRTSNACQRFWCIWDIYCN